jgi:hypothetical protein
VFIEDVALSAVTRFTGMSDNMSPIIRINVILDDISINEPVFSLIIVTLIR